MEKTIETAAEQWAKEHEGATLAEAFIAGKEYYDACLREEIVEKMLNWQPEEEDD